MKFSTIRSETARINEELKHVSLLFFEGLRELFFPAACFLCGARPVFNKSPLSGFFCPDCAGDIVLTGPDACPRCGELCDSRGREICSRCSGRTFYFDRCAAGAAYGGAVRDLVHILKFSGDLRAAFPLGRLAFLGAERALNGERPDAVTAVPLHPLKKIRRGYNQAELIARVVSAGLGVPYAGGLARRVRNTPSQGAGPGSRRHSNMSGAFLFTGKTLRRIGRGRSFAGNRPSPGRVFHILLVDDVLSTGATMSACARALRQAGHLRVTGATAAT
jgi:competence protein ComFC